MTCHFLARADVCRRRSLLPLALGIASVFGVAQASEPDAILETAAAQLAGHESGAAFALLSESETQLAGGKRFDYLFGVAALDSGHVTRAIFALERLVRYQPDDALAHAELGRAYLAAGEADHARAEFLKARDGVLPKDASAAIDRVIGVIDQGVPSPRPQLTMTLELGGGYDTNVNSATNQGQFGIPGFGGILFDTAPDSRRRGDLFTTVAGGLQMEAELSPAWVFVAEANARANVNRVAGDMNTDLLDATLAVRHTQGSHSQTFALQDGTAWVDSTIYRTANGASAQWQMQFDANTQGSVFAQWSHQVYDRQRERDTNRAVVGLGYGQAFGAGGLVYGSAYGAEELAAKATFSNFASHALGVRIGFEQRIDATAVGFVEWQRERRRYSGTEPFFEVARRDLQDDVSIGVRYRLDDGWQLLPQIHYTRARSDIVLYDYLRSVFQITAHRSFK